MKNSILILILSFLSVILFGQNWIRSYQWSDLFPETRFNSDAITCNVIPAIGGGYLLQGHVEIANEDVLVYEENVFWKIDENGDVVWRKEGNSCQSPFVSIVSNNIDRYYCLASYQGNSTLVVYSEQLDLIGYYDYGSLIKLIDMQYVEDGLIFSGFEDNPGGGGVVLKTDFQFNLIWQSTPVFTFSDGFNSVEPYNGGWVASSPRVLAHFTATGDTLWTYNDEVNYTSLFDCKVTSNGNVFSLGKYSSLYKLFKVNMDEAAVEIIADGIPYGGNYTYRSMDELPNGNLAVLCQSTNNQMLHSFTQNGSHLWSRSFFPNDGFYFGEGSKNLLTTADGDILFCTWTNSNHLYLVKTDSSGVLANDDPTVPDINASIKCFPNPACSKVTVIFKSEEMETDLNYGIYNCRGQKIFSGSIDSGSLEQSFDIPESVIQSMTTGLYLISIEKGIKRIISGKLLIVK